MTGDAIVDLNSVSMHYNAGRPSAVRALDGVTMTLFRGKTLGVVGESGCGKSSLALALMQVLPRNAAIVSGSITLDGRELVGLPESELQKIRWARISMIFQGAMNALNPVQTVGKQLMEPALRRQANGSTPAEALERALDLLKRVDLSADVMKRYPHELSGGMRQRAIIAMSLICFPEVVIADEPTTALDVVAQDRVLGLLDEVSDTVGASIILISHDIAVIIETCDQVAVMYAGQVVETGSVREVYAGARHPYTRLLFGSVPSLKGEKRRLAGIPGEPPSLSNPPGGCRFAERCAYRRDECTRGPINETKFSETHRVSCVRSAEFGQPLGVQAVTNGVGA